MTKLIRWINRRVLIPVGTKVGERSLRAGFREGEELLAFVATNEGNMWSVSNMAIYIAPGSKRRIQESETDGKVVMTKRIAFERVLSVRETRTDDGDVRREVQLVPYPDGDLVIETGGEIFPLTDIIRSHIETLVKDRRQLHFNDKIVSFVYRKYDTDGQLAWLLESCDPALDPHSIEFQTWLDGVTISSSGSHPAENVGPS